MAIEFTTASLFGGAIEADLPIGFIDVSALRPVPDNQEVYVDKDGYTSVVIDITERVESNEEHEINSDEEALRFHYTDMIDSRDDGLASGTWNHGTITLGHMNNTTACIMNATHDVASADHDLATMFMLLLVRLVEQKTDLLITINVPYSKTESGQVILDQSGNLTAEFQHGEAIRQKIAETLVVKDYSLFVDDA